MSTPSYRVVLSFDAERKVFIARAPELELPSAEGDTRTEALARLEQEIQAQVENMEGRGQRPPPALDEEEWSGELTAKVSRTLHRDLVWQARLEGVDLRQLLAEILAQGLEGRRQLRRAPRPPGQREAPEGGQPGDRDRDRLRQGYGARYHNIMEDRANFIEYVRGLEGRGGPQRQQGPGRDDRPGRDERGRRPGRGGPGGPGGPHRPDRPPRGEGGGEGGGDQ